MPLERSEEPSLSCRRVRSLVQPTISHHSFFLFHIFRRRCSRTTRVVMQQFLNQVDVREHHTTAAVALERQLIECVAFCVIGAEEAEIRLPLVGQHLATRKAAHGDNHVEK